jgi:outer membrane protein assembly factor BamB
MEPSMRTLFLGILAIITIGYALFKMLKEPQNPIKEARILWQKEAPMAGQSSPRASDLNDDGIKELIFVTGIFSPKGEGCHLMALDGKTGALLWKRSLPGDGFATPGLMDINGDGTDDLFMGGRFDDFYAFNGKDGSSLWQLKAANKEASWPVMNFNTPVFIEDQDGDGLQDLLIVQGGANPDIEVIPSLIYVVSSKKGLILQKTKSPDNAEIYAVPAILTAEKGRSGYFFTSRLDSGCLTQSFSQLRASYSPLCESLSDLKEEASIKRVNLILATGGERLGGHIFGMNYKDFKEHWRWQTGKKGVISSPLILSLKGQTRTKVIVATFDGEVAALDLESGQELWSQTFKGHETYASPGLINRGEKGYAVVVQYSKGTWPAYEASMIAWLDAKSGRILQQKPFGVFNSSSPISIDWNGDGIEDTIALSNLEPGLGPLIPSKLVVFSGADFTPLYEHDFQGFAAATPLITDLDDNGYLEIALAYWGHAARLDTPVKATTPLMWNQFRGPRFNGLYN